MIIISVLQTALKKGRVHVLRIISIFFCICLGINSLSSAYAGITFGKGQTSACAADVFGVSQIQIDQTADTANQAQITALEQAHEAALSIVLDRLLLERAAFSMPIAPEAAVDLVHIRTENSLPGRYIAEIDICFSARLLRSFFEDQKLGWAEIKSPPVLILPVFEDAAGARAWQSDNIWLQGWREEAASYQGLLDFVALKPTLLNERQLRAERLSEANPDFLIKAVGRAKAEQILWVRGFVDLTQDPPQLTMQARLYDKQGALIGDLAQTIIETDDGALSQQYEAFRTDVLGKIEEGWQTANLRQTDLSNTIYARAAITGHADWVAMQRQLSNLPVIGEVNLLSLNVTSALLSLDLNGSVDALRYSLSPLGYALETRDDTFVITRAEP